MAETSKQLAIGNITKFANSDHYQQLFRNALGKKAGQFTTSIIELTTNDAQLQQCDQRLVIAEAAKAATLDLPLSRAIGYAYVLCFKNKGIPTPTLVISARGWIQLAMRTGQYKHLNADVVYEGELQSKDKLTGAIDLSGERTSDKVIGFFAHFTLLNGFSKTLYMTVEEMCHYAKMYSPTLKFNKSVTEDTLKELMQKVSKDGPVANGSAGWLSDCVSMSIKTVLKRLIYKFGYVSVEMASAMESDEGVNTDNPATSESQEVIDVTEEVVDVTENAEVDTETGEIKEEPSSAKSNEDECPI